MSRHSDLQRTRSTTKPIELPPIHHPLAGPSTSATKPTQTPFLTFNRTFIVYEKTVPQNSISDVDIKRLTQDTSSQTSVERIANAYSQTSGRTILSSKNALVKKASQTSKKSNSQSIQSHQPVISNVASFGSTPVDPKTAEFKAKQTQWYQQQPQQGYPQQQGYMPPQQQYPPPQYQGGGYQQQYQPQQPNYQGYDPPHRQRQQGGGLGGNLKNVACIGSCLACLLLCCTSCCQALAQSAASQGHEGSDEGGYDDDDDYGDDNDD